MARAIIIYESKYGNTKLVAEAIAKSIQEISDVAPAVRELKEVNLEELQELDFILIGSPNHMGNATRGIRKFIDGLGKINLEGKRVAVFDTYIGGDFEKAVKKMEKRISEKALGLSLGTPGLSIRVDGMKGPITAGELPKCQNFGSIIGKQLKA